MSFQNSSSSSSTALSDKWIQDTAVAIKLPALSPAVCNVLLSLVEGQVKKICQQAHKFQKKSKGPILSVDDVNLALRFNKIEAIYGLSEIHDISIANDSSQLISLASYPKNQLPLYPLKPDISLHWLAVRGQQPLVPENPSAVAVENDDQQPTALPQEMLLLYSRIAGVILASESSPALSAVYEVFRTDTSIQELMPYFCRFFYQQIKANTRRLVLLTTIMKCIKSLVFNSTVNFQHHLHQILPAMFTCVIAPKISMVPTEDHWGLRRLAAWTISALCYQYSEQIPQLFARVCKTFSDAIEPDKALSTMYGGIAGLAFMGHGATRALLLPQLGAIEKRLSFELGHEAAYHTNVSAHSSHDTTAAATCAAKKPRIGLHDDRGGIKPEVTVSTTAKYEDVIASRSSGNISKRQIVESSCDRIRSAVLDALGKYIVHSVRFSSSIGKSPMSEDRRTDPPLLDLEEALIPYYASVSKEDYYSRLFI